MTIPTEAAVNEYIDRYKNTQPYYRQFLENPFWLSRRYYGEFRNERHEQYICRNFVKGMCWHRKCTMLHDITLYRE